LQPLFLRLFPHDRNPVEPGRCANDSKLLNNGPTLVYGEGPNTWWGLIIGGLNAAGFDTDEEKIDYLNHVFGTDYGSPR
jgi:hypothetical protein